MHPLTHFQVPPGQVAIHWFEQSSYAIKTSQGSVLQIDPYFPRVRPAERFLWAEPPLDETQLPTDYVLLTHSHGDHTCSESVARIWQTNPQANFIGPRESIAKILAETPVAEAATQLIQADESLSLGPVTLYAVYAKPPGGDAAANIAPPDVTHLGYVVDSEGVRLYFSGDPINTFANHPDLMAAVAALKPDIGFLTNHPNEGEFPFYDGCVKMAEGIRLKHVVPAHRACFVKRDYNPHEWAAQFTAAGPQPLIIPRDTHILYP